VLTLALFLFNLALDTAGQVAFKAASLRGHPAGARGWGRVMLDPYAAVGAACYVAEFAGWLAFLTLVPLSAAVLLSSINIVTVALAGRLLFAEQGGPLRTAGILLIAVGVAMAGAGTLGP